MEFSRIRALVLVSPFLLIACGDDTGLGGSGGTVATGGGGSTAQGGGGSVSNGGGGASSDGGGGASSDGGGGGVSNGGGGAGQGGGTGGAAAATPECEQDADCYLSDDCCECAGRPLGEVAPTCAQLCIQDTCPALGISGEASCVAGRCVAPANCDESVVTCDIPTPNCEPGSVPIVEGTCYTNTCLPALECTEVTGCASCPVSADVTCVENISQLPSFHCVDIPDPCDAADCACLGPSVCLAPFDSCAEVASGLDCSCPACLL